MKTRKVNSVLLCAGPIPVCLAAEGIRSPQNSRKGAINQPYHAICHVTCGTCSLYCRSVPELQAQCCACLRADLTTTFHGQTHTELEMCTECATAWGFPCVFAMNCVVLGLAHAPATPLLVKHRDRAVNSIVSLYPARMLSA